MTKIANGLVITSAACLTTIISSAANRNCQCHPLNVMEASQQKKHVKQTRLFRCDRTSQDSKSWYASDRLQSSARQCPMVHWNNLADGTQKKATLPRPCDSNNCQCKLDCTSTYDFCQIFCRWCSWYCTNHRRCKFVWFRSVICTIIACPTINIIYISTY